MTTNVSIIIPSFNAKRLLEKNLESVITAARPFDEIIIVDDASSDTSVEYLKKTYELVEEPPRLKDVTSFSGAYKKRSIILLVNQTNQRFASSCNRGVLSASSDIIVLLNNDVLPHEDFLEPLLPHFEDPKVFAVGCKELATTEGNKEYGRSGGKFEKGMLRHWREEDQNQTTTLWVAGGSGAFRRTMWTELDGFDLDFRPAYSEDIDLCFRARAKGWKVEFEPKSIVEHNHETTHKSVFGDEAIEVMSYKNAILLMWKDAPTVEKIKHFLWLPYNLTVTNYKSHGRFFQGFKQALLTIL